MPGRMRIVVAMGTLLAAAVTASTTIPVGVDRTGGIEYATLTEALPIPVPLMILAWLAVGATLTFDPLRKWQSSAASAGVATLAAGLALACAFGAVRGFWLSVSTYEGPQSIEASRSIWTYGSAAVIAVAGGLAARDGAGEQPSRRLIGPVTVAWVTSCLALIGLTSAHQVLAAPGGAGFSVTLGVISFAAGVSIGVASWRWWQTNSIDGHVTMRRRTSTWIAVVGLTAAVGLALIGLFVYLTTEGALTLGEILSGPALLAVISLIPRTCAGRVAAPSPTSIALPGG